MRRILVGFDGSDGGRRALDRAIAESRDSRAHVTVVSVANVPLDPTVPRNFGTLDDISAREGAALAPPPDVVVHLTEARDHLAAHGIDHEPVETYANGVRHAMVPDPDGNALAFAESPSS